MLLGRSGATPPEMDNSWHLPREKWEWNRGKIVKIETKRLLLREMTEKDEQALYQVLADSDIMQHYPYTFDEARVKGWIRRNMERYQTFGFGLWAVCLKHEAQHTVDMKQFPGITPAELEYRAKLVELHYSSDLGLLQKFLSEADESKADDSHAAASARIQLAFADTDQTSLSCIQARALERFHANTKEMEEKYGK